MQKRQILINAGMSILQVIIIGGVLFILYRFLLKTIGVEQLGIWSLVLAVTSVSQIANFGLSGSVVKFVAKYIARGESTTVSRVVQTAAISVGSFVAVMLLAGYPIARWALGLVVERESLSLALSILPYAFLSLWIMVISGVFQGCLDGCQRIDLRSLLLMGGAIINLVFCFILAPTSKLMGVAYAGVIQNLAVLIGTCLVLKRLFPSMSILPTKWDKDIFREMIGYGMNFQLISVTTMFYDPITKAFLSKFGGLPMVGYYEMASKMVQQFRALIVSANQVIVPAIADLKEKIPEKIETIYLSSYQLLFYLALFLFSLIILCIPIISELWIGHYERMFVVFGSLLTAGWFFNILSTPAYFTNLGTGELRWNVISHITIALLNIGLGFLFGLFYGGIGVVVAWTFSLAAGSSLVNLSYHMLHKISLFELIPKASKALIITCLIGILFAFFVQQKLDYSMSGLTLNSLIVFFFSIIAFVPFWLHPMRKRAMGWIMNDLLSH